MCEQKIARSGLSSTTKGIPPCKGPLAGVCCFLFLKTSVRGYFDIQSVFRYKPTKVTHLTS